MLAHPSGGLLPVEEASSKMKFTEWFDTITPIVETYLVYILKDSESNILYIGSTSRSRFRDRLNDHFRNKEWIFRVVSCEVLIFETRKEAFSAEVEKIKMETPFYNLAHCSHTLEHLLSIPGEREKMEYWRKVTHPNP